MLRRAYRDQADMSWRSKHGYFPLWKRGTEGDLQWALELVTPPSYA